jgi:SagB-type dehydrogenase family enzyme
MSTLTIALLPLVAVGALIVAASLLGRPPRRYTLNLFVGLLLLVYFLATSALGIFWVAAQELPVFDVHYLFGYLTLILVLVHVTINWRPLLNYARKLAPRAALSGRRRFRPTIRVAATIVGLGAVATVGYWYGHGKGATTIRVLGAPTASVAAGQSPEHGGAVRPASAIGRQLIDPDDGPPQGVADYFHTRTAYTHAILSQKWEPLNWDEAPSVYKEYETGEVHSLPSEFVTVDVPTGTAIDRRRRRVDGLASVDISIAQLSTLLHLTNGKTKSITRPMRSDLALRSAPSAGALYPTVTYVLVRQVSDLTPGLYHYDVRRHALRLLRDNPEIIDRLAEMSGSDQLLRDASLVLVFTADFYRSAFKYKERSWRYSLLDTGHVALNAMAAAAALGWASQPIGRFDDGAVNALLGLKEGREEALLLVPVGAAADAGPEPGEWAFEASPKIADGGPVADIISIGQGMTRLARAGAQRAMRFRVPAYLEPRFPRRPQALAPPTELGAPLFETIQKRRSRRNWESRGMTPAALSSLLYHSYGLRNGAGDPSVEHSRALRFYVVILEAGDAEPGVYEYLRNEHALSLVKPGRFRNEVYTSNLYQELARDAGLLVVLTIDRQAMVSPDGDRGYRYAALDAGMIGEQIYLQSVALGLGTCGIGAFFDGDIAELVGIDPVEEHVLYTLAVGVPSE